MNRFSTIKSIPFLFFVLFACSQNIDKKNTFTGKYNNTISYQEFQNPDSEFRSFPFYSLNDKLEPSEIKRQVRSLKDAGMGGMYLHSRDGLLTSYLSHDWWKAIDAAVEEANKLDLWASFYDEDKWPSGYAGGIIPRMGEEFRAKSLVRLKKSTPLPAGSKIIISDDDYNYIEYTAQMGNPVFNGTAWVDLMNPVVVDSFINSTHKPYFDKYKNQTSLYTPTIFSDEPHIHARYFDRLTPHEGIYSYSPTILDKFEQLWGYQLSDKIPQLFEEKKDWRKVRLQYYQTVALQYEESFTKQITEYCAENGFLFTGHYLGEDALEKVRDRIGNSMLHYRSMHVPGIDHLGLTISGRLLTARRLTSVANQFEMPRRMSELFGITGHNMNFEDRKWIAGWHAIHGINHFVPHLTAYSLKGLRKRDYPPTFSYHQPYWAFNNKIEDYMARLAYATTIGKTRPQTLVISPLESEYIKGESDGNFTFQMLQVLRQLQAGHFDYDIGDEQILADTAFVNNNELIVGAMSYPNIILPDMLTIRETTYNMLSKVVENGGKLFYTHRFPAYIDGDEAKEKLEKLKKIANEINIDNLATELTSHITPPVVLSGSDNELIWTQNRYTEDGKLVQFYNSSHTKAVLFTVNADQIKNNPVLWNPSNGKCFELTMNNNGNIEIELPSSSSVWVTTGKLSNNATIAGTYNIKAEKATIKQLDAQWSGRRLNPNMLTIDFASYKTEGRPWSQSEPVIAIMKQLTDENYNGHLELKYSFIIEHKPNEINLSVEQPGMFDKIKINSQPVAFTADTFFIDHGFPVANIAKQIHVGVNTIEMELNFSAPNDTSSIQKIRYGSELESIYVFGNFAVNGENHSILNDTHRNATGLFTERPAHGFSSFAITKEDATFEGDIVPNGYPFYSGGFVLEQTFELNEFESGKNRSLHFPNTEAIVMQVELNGKVLDTLTWSPFTIDISDAAVTGENKLKVTMYNSLRNLLGPHHQKRGEVTRVGPKSFTGTGGFPDPRGDNNWYELRKTGDETKIWTDTYYFIPFGFLKSPVIIETNKQK